MDYSYLVVTLAIVASATFYLYKRQFEMAKAQQMCDQIQSQYELDQSLREKKKNEALKLSQQQIEAELQEKIKTMIEKKREEVNKKTQEMIERQKDLAAPQIKAVDAFSAIVEKSGQIQAEYYQI